ncbi:hypothetical protein C5167_042916 [Papaver somniferum]|uniref:Uncharacterized protein n=1 Tax=Papaver somniferum TaxID=3469 RepID=A0A4Y7L7B6_PAPSO|nr:hypothetical protein C5167_042916 [Papaver somniferum]
MSATGGEIGGCRNLNGQEIVGVDGCGIDELNLQWVHAEKWKKDGSDSWCKWCSDGPVVVLMPRTAMGQLKIKGPWWNVPTGPRDGQVSTIRNPRY